MALSLPYTANDGEVPTGANFMANFNQLINNPIDLFSPATKAIDMNGFELILDGDGDSSITADTDDRLDLRLSATDLFRFDGTVATPINGLNFIAGATGTNVTLDAGITGADAAAGLRLLANGTGPIVVDNDTDPVDLRFMGAAGGYNNVLTDVNGNEILRLQGVASAVNQIDVLNAAISGTPTITASGGDTNISLNLVPKGSGVLQVNGVTAVTTAASQAEMEAASATNRVVTPGIQHQHPGMMKGIGQLGVGGGINWSYGISSIADTGTGLVTVTWSNTFTSTEKMVPQVSTQNSSELIPSVSGLTSTTVTAFRSANVSGTPTDPTVWLVSIGGDL